MSDASEIYFRREVRRLEQAIQDAIDILRNDQWTKNALTVLEAALEEGK